MDEWYFPIEDPTENGKLEKYPDSITIMHLLINPFCFPHIVVRYSAKRICSADQLIEVHADAIHRIYQGKEVCMGSLFDWTIQHHLPNQSGSG